MICSSSTPGIAAWCAGKEIVRKTSEHLAGGIMSAPVREPDDNGSLNDRPLNYQPKRARQAEPPWKRKKQRGVFAGDVVIVELRTQRLAPDRVPEPPLPDSTARVFGRVGWIVGVIAVVATGTVGYLWRPAPQATPPSQQLALTSDRPNLAPELSVSAANRNASSLDSSKPAAVPPAAGRLAPRASATQFNEQDPRAPVPAQELPRQPTVNAAEVASMMKN